VLSLENLLFRPQFCLTPIPVQQRQKAP